MLNTDAICEKMAKYKAKWNKRVQKIENRRLSNEALN
jgi:hypothetical protein